MGKPTNTVLSIQSKILKQSNGCWDWQGSLTNGGYGQLRFEGKLWRAHRLFYTIHKGVIPNKLFVCHSCDNPKCVNPDHMFLGTIQENSNDMKKKGYLLMSATTTGDQGSIISDYVYLKQF